ATRRGRSSRCRPTCRASCFVRLFGRRRAGGRVCRRTARAGGRARNWQRKPAVTYPRGADSHCYPHRRAHLSHRAIRWERTAMPSHEAEVRLADILATIKSASASLEERDKRVRVLEGTVNDMLRKMGRPSGGFDAGGGDERAQALGLLQQKRDSV